MTRLDLALLLITTILFLCTLLFIKWKETTAAIASGWLTALCIFGLYLLVRP